MAQGTVTLSDTWFHSPFGDLLMLLHVLLRPVSPNLPCLFSTFHLEYPSVLSRFLLQEDNCFIHISNILFGCLKCIVCDMYKDLWHFETRRITKCTCHLRCFYIQSQQVQCNETSCQLKIIKTLIPEQLAPNHFIIRYNCDVLLLHSRLVLILCSNGYFEVGRCTPIEHKATPVEWRLIFNVT